MNPIENTASDEPIKIWIVEDLDDYREDLVSYFETTPEIDCRENFRTFEAAEKAAECCRYSHWPDVILMDIQLPGKNGIDAIPELQRLIPGVDIIILTSFGDKRRIFDAICAGASGYLLKTDGLADIVKGIQEVHAGGSPLNSNVAAIVLTMFSHFKKPEPDTELKEIELEILKQLADGSYTKEIAAALDMKTHQINYHVRNIYRKLHTNSLSGAVARALRRGLIS
ncbi:response regulator transcription factor [Verrucomicrobia bacterium S94]|nr:response regulator transcription factor [Verrucomicrobia bacterium S94]